MSQLCGWQYSHKETLQQTFYKWNVLFDSKLPFRVFEPSFGRATYAVYFRLIGKRIVDFLLVLIELFFARCYDWGATSECQLKIGVFAGTESVWPKILGTRGRPPPTILLVGKLGQSIFHNGIKCRQKFLSFCYNLPVCQTDGQNITDGQTDGRTDRRISHGSIYIYRGFIAAAR